MVQFKIAKYNIAISTSSIITNNLKILGLMYLKTKFKVCSLLPCFHRALFRLRGVGACVYFGRFIGSGFFKLELSSTSVNWHF